MRCARRGGVLAVLVCAVAAQAHIVYGAKTLRSFVAEADLVLHARILSSGEPVGLTTEGSSAGRPTVAAEVVEVLKGELDDARVRFAQHGHGVAPFAPGDETLLFLLRVERSRELGALSRDGTLAWVSLQEHGDRYPVREDTRAALLGAVRSYIAAPLAPPEARDAALRRATVALLGSGDPDLAASALRDLVLAPEAPLVTEADLPALLPLLEEPATSMGVRVALLAELTRRGLVDAEPHWLRLLSDQTPARGRVAAIRAAGISGSGPVRARLRELLGDPDPDVAAAAAASLGVPGRDDAVAPLAGALSHAVPKVRSAAVRGLGRIATPAARQALAAAADAHPDPATRRRARAELAKRAPR